MAATMWILFIRKIFTSLKQQNLFKIQSKWSEFFKSTFCVRGCIKILMMHFLHFVCIKMHDFCVNTISARFVLLRSYNWQCARNFSHGRFFYICVLLCFVLFIYKGLCTFEWSANNDSPWNIFQNDCDVCTGYFSFLARKVKFRRTEDQRHENHRIFPVESNVTPGNSKVLMGKLCVCHT